MPDDDQQQQQQTPPINLADPAALTAAYQQYLQYLQQVGNQRPAQAPVISQAQLDANKPTSLLGQLGEALGGGAPSDVPMTSDQRERAGIRGLFNFSRGLLGTGTFDSIGQALDRGFTEAERGQYNQEAQVAYGQAAAQDWQRQQMADRLAALKESIPLLQGIQRLNMPSLYGPGGGPGAQAGNAPGSVPSAFTGDLEKDRQIIAQRESGGDPTILNYVARADPTAYARGATASGKYQFVNSTWRQGMQEAGLSAADQAKYPTAMSAPESVQDQVFTAVYKNHGTAPWDPSKFGANWVLQPGGGYQLVKGAPYTPPPGQTPPSATPAQPATAPPGQAAPGTLTAGAPATAAPQGVPLPPGGKPGDVVPATVGIGGALNPATAAKPPDQRAEVTGTGVAGRIPGAYDVASLGPVAPPSSATAPSPAATQPPAQPGWGTVIGSYGRGPAATAPTPAPPPGAVPQAPQPPAQQPPAQQPPAQPAPQQPPARDIMARNQDGSFVVPDDKVSVPEYQQRNRYIYSPQELAQLGVTVPANSTAIQTAYANIQSAERDANAARAAAQDLFTRGQDPSKAMDAANAADAKAAQARQDYTNLLQDADEKNGERLTNLYKEQNAQLATDYANKVTTPANTARQQQQATDLAIKQKQAELGLTSRQSQIDAATADVKNAHEAITKLQSLSDLSHRAGDADVLTALPGLRDWLQRLDALSPDQTGKYAAQTALEAANNGLIGILRNGTGFQRTTNMDLQFLQKSGPGGPWTPEEYRNSTTQFLLEAFRHQQEYSTRLAAYLSEGKPYAEASDLADQDTTKKLGAVIPQVPTTDKNGTPFAGNDRAKWMWDNLDTGQFYKTESGALARMPDKSKFRRPE